MDNLKEDLRFSIRLLLKKPGFAAVAILTLALGIGANTAIFSVVDTVLLRPLPYKDSERIVNLWEANARSKTIHVSNPNFQDWRARSRSFDFMAEYWGFETSVTGGAEPVRAKVSGVSRDFFSVFGVTPIIGRLPSAEDHKLGANLVAVVSYGFWQRLLGGDNNLGNKKLTIEGDPADVVGVLPKGFSFPAEAEVWIPMETTEDTSSRTAHNYEVIAKLKSDTSVRRAQDEMTSIGEKIIKEYSDADPKMTVNVVSLLDQTVGDIRPALLIMLAAVAFVLLIACANVANLMLSRAVSRQKEMAIRAALGAERGRIVRQLLTESVMLGIIGGVLGLLLAMWLINVLIALSPSDIPRINQVGIDGRTLAFTTGISLLTSVLFGLAPALRISKTDLTDSLKDGGRSSSGSGHQKLRSLLVIAEITFTVVLLVGAGLLTKSFWNLMQVNPGFNPDRVLIMDVALTAPQYLKAENTVTDFYQQSLERVKTIPGVESVGAISSLPLGPWDPNGTLYIANRPDPKAYGGFRIVSPEYFRAMTIPLLSGRFFTERDTTEAPAVGILAKGMVDRYWPNEDPLGKQIKFVGMDKQENWMTVVGVVGDVKHGGLDAKTYPEVYMPIPQRTGRARYMTIVIKTKDNPANVASAVRSAVQSLDSGLPAKFDTMERLFSKSIANRRYNMLLLGIFAGLAMVLSMIGIYGVMSYSVSQSVHEIGIRIALGAQNSNILRMVLGKGAILAGIGLVAGAGGAFALTRVMTSLLFGVTTTDPSTFIAVIAGLFAVTMLACHVPARRAMRVDPMVALRNE